MGKAKRKIQRRTQARSRLTWLIDNSQHVIVIHYSCEGFYNCSNGSSPRITSIAVRNLKTGQSTSFSIHQIGEVKGYLIDEIDENYNELEKIMLDNFYSYANRHINANWLHWNMRNIDYGFQAIAHRYRVLGGEPVEINETQLANLSSLLSDIYGSYYIEHPKLPNITKKNKITDRDFLKGADEALAFENKEYVKLHRSTLRKVEILASLIQRAEENTLKTNTSRRDFYILYPEVVAEWLKDHWISILLSFIAAIVSILSFALSIGS
ncbi:MAG: hypothetical protein AAF614_03740 [Chloroflexota bacterium]